MPPIKAGVSNGGVIMPISLKITIVSIFLLAIATIIVIHVRLQTQKQPVAENVIGLASVPANGNEVSELQNNVDIEIVKNIITTIFPDVNQLNESNTYDIQITKPDSADFSSSQYLLEQISQEGRQRFWYLFDVDILRNTATLVVEGDQSVLSLRKAMEMVSHTTIMKNLMNNSNFYFVYFVITSPEASILTVGVHKFKDKQLIDRIGTLYFEVMPKTGQVHLFEGEP